MTENTPAGAPIQHLGAASREHEPESLDGDFASSGEAEEAHAAYADYDTELTETDLNELWRADTAAREHEGITGAMRDYVTEGLNRDYQEPGEEPGEAMFSQARGQEPRAEEAAFGSTPSHFPSQPPALSTQTPGHLGSMPTGPSYANAGRAAEQPASGSGTAATLADENAQLERWRLGQSQRSWLI